jgi:SAM-dependent methyltransferase
MTTRDKTLTLEINDSFLKEYRSVASLRRYTKQTAGYGINYLLEEVYGRIYTDVLETQIPKERVRKGIRVLEFGCGGAMNVLHLLSLMERRGIALERAYGTDFSDKLIEAAHIEASEQLTAEQRSKIYFCVARNEALIDEMSAKLGINPDTLSGTFDVIIGVNTIRYCHRLDCEMECVRNIYRLLRAGGICIVIDMNNGFPLFRSRLRDRLTKEKKAYYLPTLDEYARPFSLLGFEILCKKHFCWIPHSASPRLTSLCRTLAPALSALAPSRAMRSLVVSRKPAQRD